MSKFDKKNNEIVPDDYFVKFGDRLFEKAMEEEIFMPKDYPILNSIDKEKDFTTPNNYFNNLEFSQKQKKSFSLLRSLSIAATVLIAVLLFTMSEKGDLEIETGGEAMEDLASLEYLNDDLDALESYDIEQLITYESNDELILDDIDNEIILEYLMDESDQFDLVSIY